MQLLASMRSTREYGERPLWRQKGGLKFVAVLARQGTSGLEQEQEQQGAG